MHVRIAWEIYHHQAKQNPDKAASMKTASEMLRPPSHMYPPSAAAAAGLVRPHDLPSSTFPPTGLPGRPSPYEPGPLPPTFMSSPASHIGTIHGSFAFLRTPSIVIDPLSFCLYFDRSFPVRSLRITVWRLTVQWPFDVLARSPNGFADGGLLA